ncbi:hypothetical protein KKI93_15415 [Xenorhabdus bovienii]|uniref:hypothetical protein n=1 Tax=Xenorhabdus bovienii TaxID=40576 RepID=UPI0023B2EAE7|nr:hypothetical protein [Xenorhabdus bovienii]MDE9565412.1 hypothetical protein [Xenorhabdus bovienii]
MNDKSTELAKKIKELATDLKYKNFDFILLQNQIKDDWGQDTIPAKYFAVLSNYHQIIKLCEEIEKSQSMEASVKSTLPLIVASRCDNWDKTLRALCDLSTSHELLSERLTEYENMEPVGHFYRCGDGFIGEVIDEYKNDDDVYPLYRHPKKELKFTAEIELTDFVHGADGKSIAFGYVFNDSRKRFEDGVEIKTSLVTNTETYKTDGYIKTQNSIYKIRE